MQKIFLILASLSFVACGEMPKFPQISKWMLDVPNQKCAEFKLTNAEQQAYEYVKSVDIYLCDGFFAMSPKDEVKVGNWIKDVQDKYEQLKHCEGTFLGN